jgi:hypothetical protein
LEGSVIVVLAGIYYALKAKQAAEGGADGFLTLFPYGVVGVSRDTGFDGAEVAKAPCVFGQTVNEDPLVGTRRGELRMKAGCQFGALAMGATL